MTVAALMQSILSGENHRVSIEADQPVVTFLSNNSADPLVVKYLTDLGELSKGLKIVTKLRIPITRNITSQIIHYKDAFKLPNPALEIPYFIYNCDTQPEFGIVLVSQKDCGYLYAKALYFCLTEKDGLLDQAMNNLIAVWLNEDNYRDVLRETKNALLRNETPGKVQRELDRLYLPDMETLRDQSIKASMDNFDQLRSDIETNPTKKRAIINKTVAECFLLKKSMYVHFMKDKDLLDTRYDGDCSQQRSVAKKYTDMITFVSYADLWHLCGNNV